MFISFVIPVYNVEKYLKQCLGSVIGQTYTDFEIICINDGSTDGSNSILDEYASNHTNFTLLSQDNKGLSAARNAGIRAAKGDYVFFLDSDDWIEPETLKILAEMQKGEDLVCFNGRRFFEDGTVEKQDTGIIEEGLTGWEYYNRYALISRKFHFVCTVLRLYRREFLIQNNIFFEEGIYHEDNLFTPLACYYARTVKVIPDSLYIYRIRSGSITHSATQKHMLDTVKVANKLSVFFIPKTDVDKQTIYREIAGEYFKGFMQEERQNYGNNDKELSELINWKFFRLVSVYPRHKRIYWLLKVYPQLFRMYLQLEQKLKITRFFHAKWWLKA
jgi:glycosyltransferase involved in cell wall biosynthesis